MQSTTHSRDFFLALDLIVKAICFLLTTKISKRFLFLSNFLSTLIFDSVNFCRFCFKLIIINSPNSEETGITCRSKFKLCW
ncbi:unnamed protein product [Rhizophagus irregularis]|nr:unnamed protein product [Rhizophagus irregularis]CAB5163507.1 unnamed protein product [Rhizophagus irregularis]